MKSRVYFKVVVPEVFLERIKLNQCPVCCKHKDYWTRRKDWRCCSKNCTTIWWHRYQSVGWNHVRMEALIRDNFTCVKCSFKGNTNNLIGDHIKPIALGGEEFDLDNIQTLCIKCNRIKTSSDLKKIAEQRRRERDGRC